MAQRQKRAGESREKLRRRGGDEIGTRLKRARDDAADHERDKVEQAQNDATIRRHEALHANDADAVHHLDLIPAIAIAVEDFPFRKIRRVRDERDVVSPLRPIDGALVNARGRRVALGRKVVGDEKDLHARRADDNDSAPADRRRDLRPLELQLERFVRDRFTEARMPG